MRYHIAKSRSRGRVIGPVIIVVVLLFGLAAFGAYKWYQRALRPVSNDQRTQIVTIEPGSGTKQIAAQLADQKLIRSARALEFYAYSKNLRASFQAGSYAVSPSADTKEIVATLTQGNVTTRLVTIVPGRRIDQVRADLINDGFSPEAVDKALLPNQYADLPAYAFKPANVQTLEGLLWPDSYQRDAQTDPSFIIRSALEQTALRLTPDLQAALAARGLTPYQGLILASIVEQEVSKPNDRAQAAQVFLSRLKMNIMLGSDVTANYGAILAGRAADLTFDSAYNTLKNTGLPPSPIGTASVGSLLAVSQPANTDWLFFVAGDNGTTYFSRTLAEHEALAAKHCFKLCGR